MNNTSNDTSSRRTFSSPYLSSLRDSRARSQAAATQNRNARLDKPTPRPPPRGSRSAPPNYHSTHPEIHEYYQRRVELGKQMHKTLLKAKLERLTAYQEQLEKQINDLEKRCGDAGVRSFKERQENAQKSTQQQSPPKQKQFRVLGGCQGNLTYKIHRKPDKNGKIRSFSLEIDVKGFVAENILVDTDEAIMTVKASRQNGTNRDLKIVAPSPKDMEKAYVHSPNLGVLVIDF